MGSELQRRNLDFYERQRPIGQRQTCAAVSSIQEAACGYVGQRFGGRAGAVFAAELCRAASQHYQVCERVFDYISPPPRGVRYARQPYLPFVSQQRHLPRGPLTRLFGMVQERYGIVLQSRKQERQAPVTDLGQPPSPVRRQRGLSFPVQVFPQFSVRSIVPVAIGGISLGSGGGGEGGTGVGVTFGSGIGIGGIGIGGVF